MNRTEHLQWSKDRANALLEEGKIAEGMASFTSDMSKHEETNETIRTGLSHQLIMIALMSNDATECINCVNGFN